MLSLILSIGNIEMAMVEDAKDLILIDDLKKQIIELRTNNHDSTLLESLESKLAVALLKWNFEARRAMLKKGKKIKLRFFDNKVKDKAYHIAIINHPEYNIRSSDDDLEFNELEFQLKSQNN